MNKTRFHQSAFGILLVFIVFVGFNATLYTEGNCYYNDIYSQSDERLVATEVNAIIAPGTFKHFVFYIISGSTVANGRLMYGVDALFSFIPYHIWGVEGQILATRLTHMLVLLAAFILLLQTFIRDYKWRLIILPALLLCPDSLYMCIVPNPLPYSILMFALFAFYARPNAFSPGWYYLFLGIMFGFSMLTIPVILFFVFVGFFMQSGKPAIYFKLKSALTAFVFMMLGWILNVPTVIAGLWNPIYWESYFNQTFYAMTIPHGNLTQYVLEWLKQLFFKQFVSPGIIFFVFIALALFRITTDIRKKEPWRSSNWLLFVGLFLMTWTIFLQRPVESYRMFTSLIFCTVAFGAVLQKRHWKLAGIIPYAFLLFFIPQLWDMFNKSDVLSSRWDAPQFQSCKVNSILALDYLQHQKASYVSFEKDLYYPNRILVNAGRYKPFSELKNMVK